jgi:murein L,D-transpeptidase YcbB/YkuD
MTIALGTRLVAGVLGVFLAAILSILVPAPAAAQNTAFKQAVAEASARDQDVFEFYRDTGYQPIWTGSGSTDRARRAALVKALAAADDHGLPTERYDLSALDARMRAARSPRDRGLLEVEMSRIFLQYARDIQTGALVPAEVDKHIVRSVPYRVRKSYLTNLTKSAPEGFFRALPPRSTEYTGLMKNKLVLENLLARGGWGGTVQAGKIEPGDRGRSVVALRDRLVRMGYLQRSAATTYDTDMQKAIIRFQADHGLVEDGVVGQGTLAEINVSVAERLQSVMVAMERERWVNKDRGARHIEVNLADFSAKIIDGGKVTFSTRTVIGARDPKRQSLEFSDQMEFMVINPSWFVPRSIATSEYLPDLQANPNAVSHLIITDRKGRRVDRSAVDFTKYTKASFPYSMRQPPSQSNALGLVKFMFPNEHNIYLHDTPAKNLFSRETRAFSHGCIRLADPFGFAYALLARQTGDPKGFFQSRLATGKETQVDLEIPVPVHLIYRTAFIDEKGGAQYRRDVYGRDARIWEALSQAGVALRAVRG